MWTFMESISVIGREHHTGTLRNGGGAPESISSWCFQVGEHVVLIPSTMAVSLFEKNGCETDSRIKFPFRRSEEVPNIVLPVLGLFLINHETQNDQFLVNRLVTSHKTLWENTLAIEVLNILILFKTVAFRLRKLPSNLIVFVRNSKSLYYSKSDILWWQNSSIRSQNITWIFIQNAPLVSRL